MFCGQWLVSAHNIDHSCASALLLLPVSIVARDLQQGFLAQRHLHDPLVPPFYDLSDTNLELEWSSSVDTAVEFLAIASQSTRVATVVKGLDDLCKTYTQTHCIFRVSPFCGKVAPSPGFVTSCCMSSYAPLDRARELMLWPSLIAHRS